jgi:hypothetical protein
VPSRIRPGFALASSPIFLRFAPCRPGAPPRAPSLTALPPELVLSPPAAQKQCFVQQGFFHSSEGVFDEYHHPHRHLHPHYQSDH